MAKNILAWNEKPRGAYPRIGPTRFEAWLNAPRLATTTGKFA